MTTEPEDESVAPPTPAVPAEKAKGPSGAVASAMVAGGIFLSRIAGLIRDRVLAQFFGTSLYADVFSAGLRMPNVLQNLLGEGTLSASFIPVYAELLEEGKEEEAGRVAGAIFSLLFAVAGLLALLGVFLAPLMVSVFLPGFEGARRELTIGAVRILFPMTGVLVLSAWSLGVLNSHRHFFIPYFAPVLWNGAIIATFLLFGDSLSPARLVIAASWGALVGGVLQFAIQLPWVYKLEPRLRLSFGRKVAGAREAVKNAGPAILGRGVVQLSGYIDMVLASLLAIGAVAVIRYAQTLYVLPVSLFGMSIAAAELPELSRQRGGTMEALRLRTSEALQRVAFYVIPSFVAFALLGDVLIAALFQTGEFDRADTLLVYFTLLGYTVGLLASTSTRLFSSAFFALRDTKTPARIAALRVALAAVLGFVLMTQFEELSLWGYTVGPGVLGGFRVAGQPMGAVGLALGAGIAAWVEWGLLYRNLRGRLGAVGAGAGTVARMFGAALAGVAVAWAIRWLLPDGHPAFGWAPSGSRHILRAVVVLGGFGVTYFAVAAALGLGEAGVVFRRIRGMLGRSR